MATVESSLSALRDREMVYERETSAFAEAREYMFKHTLLRETTYGSMLKKLRRSYHGLVADWLIQESGERATELTGMIADHLELAGRSAEAVDYLLRAGDQARLLYAQEEASAYYQRALAILKEGEQVEQAARTLMKLGLTYHTAFAFHRSRDAYDEAFSLWQRATGTEEVGSLPKAPHALRLPFVEPLTLDPSSLYDVASEAIMTQLFWGLVELNSQLDVLPGLARYWEVTEGGRRYAFHLRDDARWSDGEPVTAADFVCMVHRMLHPITGSYMASLLHCIRGARAYNEGEASGPEGIGLYALDRYQLVMELEEPIAYALHLFALGRPVPRHAIQVHGDAWAEAGHIVTNGPFVLTSWERGVSMTLECNSDYRGQVRGNVHRVELHFLPWDDWAAQLAMYEADELDVLDLRNFPPSALDDARRRHAGEYISAPDLSTFGIAFDAAHPPFDDPRVRQALAMAIDRETLSGIVLAGTQYPATGGFVPPRMPGHSPGIGLPHDVAYAQRLLADAGYPGGRGLAALEALVLDSPSSLREGEFVQRCWREHLGVRSTWAGLGYEDLQTRWHTADVGSIRWSADYPDPDSFLRVAMAGSRAYTQWSNEAYDRLVEEARMIKNAQERIRAYREADRILTQSAGVVPLLYGRNNLLMKPWLRNCVPSPTGNWFWKDVIIEPH
jgi:oligopeptide transport system substrate-binding protein